MKDRHPNITINEGLQCKSVRSSAKRVEVCGMSFGQISIKFQYEPSYL